jgi:hypothetical protein
MKPSASFQCPGRPLSLLCTASRLGWLNTLVPNGKADASPAWKPTIVDRNWLGEANNPVPGRGGSPVCLLHTLEVCSILRLAESGQEGVEFCGPGLFIIRLEFKLKGLENMLIGYLWVCCKAALPLSQPGPSAYRDRRMSV